MSENNNYMKKLKTISSVSPHLAFNKYVIHGYRSDYSFKECLKSLFFLHNETVNIYTHGIMTVYLLSILPWKWQNFSKSTYGILQAIHWFASVLPFVGSSVYHLFMCHKNGRILYRNLLRLDMTGVWAVNTFGYIIAVFTTFHCNTTLQLTSVFLYVAFSLLALYFIIKATTPFQRFLPLCYYLVVRPMVIITRFYLNKYYRNSLGIGLYAIMDLTAFLGAVINVLKVPERFLPGCVDFALNSHQIMHILTIVSMLLLNEAARNDIIFLQSTKC